MQAIVFDTPGDASVLRCAQAPTLELTNHAVRIRIHAAGVNRADIVQRQGNYKAPPGASAILGLECAGEIVACGEKVKSHRVGDSVMALLAGGGYAEETVVDADHVLPVPHGWSMTEAAGFMETYLTAFLNIFQIGGVQKGDSILVHGGASGIGTSAIALCKQEGVAVWVTAGSDEKCQRCLEHGATGAINYKTQKFADVVQDKTAGNGVALVLDCIGGPYVADNLRCLRQDGKVVIIGLMGGTQGNVDAGLMLRKRLSIIASTMRNRTSAQKSALVAAFMAQFGTALQSSKLRPVIDEVFPLAQAAAAHQRMQDSSHFGKLVLVTQFGRVD